MYGVINLVCHAGTVPATPVPGSLSSVARHVPVVQYFTCQHNSGRQAPNIYHFLQLTMKKVLILSVITVFVFVNQLDLHKTWKVPPSPKKAKKLRASAAPLQLSHVGSQYGGWTYDSSNLTPDSIVYSIGLGTDTSWDEGIMMKHKLNVWGFDPTPMSLEYVRTRQELKHGLFHLTPEGLATVKGSLKFTKPKNKDHVSMRAGEHEGLGEMIEVPVNTLESWMQANGHTHLDILKIDIEGSEYDVLEDWIRRDFFPFDQLLVEWHFRFLPSRDRHDAVLKGLKQRGWNLVHSQNDGQETTFVRSSIRRS